MSKLFQESRNKKSVRIATFLRLAIAASFPIADWGAKTQVICRVKAPFSLCGDREEFAIAKKLQRCRDFCFHDGWIVPTGRFHDGRIASTGGYRNGRITVTGQITHMCVFSAAARAAAPRAADRAKRPPALPDWVGRQPVCRGVCCGLDGAAAPRSWGGGKRQAVDLARLGRVECQPQWRQRSWPQG